MSAGDLIAFADAVGKLGPIAVVLVVTVLIVYIFYKKWLVVGSVYSDVEARLLKTEQQRDDALEMAAKLTGILEAGRRGSYRGR